MGKKKEKEKVREKGKPGRKELQSEIERLRTQNEALLARLERIAEIAGSEVESTGANGLFIEEPKS